MGLSIAWMRKAAAAGNASAMEELASKYEDGEGIERDVSAAVRWYLAATASGRNNVPLARLISIYRDGAGPAAEASQVFAAFGKGMADDKDDPIALYGMGVMYRSGQGVTKDVNEADRLFRRAQRLGYMGPRGDGKSVRGDS